MTDSPIIEMRALEADKLCELIEGLIEANKALALRVDGLERAVKALGRPVAVPAWDMSKGISIGGNCSCPPGSSCASTNCPRNPLRYISHDAILAGPSSKHTGFDA